MGFKTINDLSEELRRRIDRLNPVTSEAAIIRALIEVHDSGSYTFDLLGTASGATVGIVHPGDATAGEFTLPGDCDTRKAIFVANSTGIPLLKVGLSRFWETFALNIVVGEGYGTYTIAGRKLLVRPGTAQTIGVRYHVEFVPPSGDEHTRLTPQLDELVVDLAEAKERRIYDVGDHWAALEQQTLQKITKSLDGFLSISKEPMPVMEAAIAGQEANTLGRA